METLLKADIFFFVTTVVVIILAILIAIAMVYIVRILRDVQHVSMKVREESDKIIADVDDLREDLKKEGNRVTGIISLLVQFLGKYTKKLIGKKKK